MIGDINGTFRILKWRYVSTIFLAIFWGYIPVHSPYIGLIYIYGRYTSNQSVPERAFDDTVWRIENLLPDILAVDVEATAAMANSV